MVWSGDGSDRSMLRILESVELWGYVTVMVALRMVMMLTREWNRFFGALGRKDSALFLRCLMAVWLRRSVARCWVYRRMSERCASGWWGMFGMGMCLWEALMVHAKVCLIASGVGRVAYLGSEMARSMEALRTVENVSALHAVLICLGLVMGTFRWAAMALITLNDCLLSMSNFCSWGVRRVAMRWSLDWDRARDRWDLRDDRLGLGELAWLALVVGCRGGVFVVVAWASLSAMTTMG